ncbi:AAA family ATPase [Ramlibacter sp. G-1-2-2]|uniref:AAA family ATPase n=1 Tax=Ramlibacter agri TaxID=2728837 RepID=A0A848GWK1_9BURK|nr:NERD domain-containing protein/DEAD/DEAH box helicase [Ramlibacter agri]NML42507.1 AAA family ATPase [Ramlibacter agri]
MAVLHPTLHARSALTAGAYRELDVLRELEDGLPGGWDVFHNLDWASVFNGRPQVGEVDIAVVSPGGFLLLVEVKAGAIDEQDRGLVKRYGNETSDIGAQLRRNHAALLSRLKDASLRDVRAGTLLVLPDHHLQAPVLAHTPEGIVDAAAWAQLCARVQQLVPWQAVGDEARGRLLDFLANRFHVVPDVSVQVGQVQRASAALASGLATWVPSVQHDSGLYVVDATAGSGKTQLALALLRDAHAARQRSAYVCFNRPLADHMARIAPSSCVVTTFHELAVEHARRQGEEPDFRQPGIHERLASSFADDAATAQARWDLLVVDEHQDFDPAWVQALLGLLAPQGRAYVMGDPAQQVYARDGFALPDAVAIRCMDNFRSPRKVVEAINMLRLAPQAVQARSPFAGDVPGFHTHAPGAGLRATEDCIRQLLGQGMQPEQIAVISFAGLQNSAVLKAEALAGLRTRRFRGEYDKAGNALFTQGDLLAETVYRFKGQSAPVVVLCEVEFAELGEKELRKLFVGFTRAQFRVECVLSEPAAQLLMARAG